MSSRVLVTGCGRSGTGYMARLLTELGIPCGHEALFHPESLAADEPPAWPAGVRAESSWLAAPFVERLPEGTLVLHQTRDPLTVVRSWARIRVLEGRTFYRRFAERHAPKIASGTPLERCARYWLDWNALAQRASTLGSLRYVRYRLEDVDAEFLARLCDAIDERVTDERIESALANVPRDANTSGAKERDAEIEWTRLADAPFFGELRAQAESYGYAAA